MQSLKIKEWKLLELQITQTRNHLSTSNEKMSKFKTSQKWKKNIREMCIKYKKGGAYLQCVNKNYAKFEYKGMKTVGVTDYTNPLCISDGEIVLVQHPSKMVKYLLNMHKIDGAQL